MILAHLGDCTSLETMSLLRKHVVSFGKFPLMVADPPYGNILKQYWDRVPSDTKYSSWLAAWMHSYEEFVLPGGAAYVWGGVGKPGDRTFYKFILKVEKRTNWDMANHLTWSKKRAYGVQHNYLFTREEIAYFILGDIKRPRTFNVPLTETLRGYSGYDPNYPAKSEYLRRTNIWTDVTEIFRGKRSDAEKPVRLAEIMVKTNTNAGEWVLDPFTGSGTTGEACVRTGRNAFLIERDPVEFQKIKDRLGKELEEV